MAQANYANITRRMALSIFGTAAVAAPIVTRAIEMTARERYEFHLAELQKAAIEIDPRVRFTAAENYLGDRNRPLAVFIMGSWASGRYEGDGVYGGGSEWDREDRYRVKLLDRQIDGQRGFSVIQVGETNQKKRMRLSEDHFEAFIGKLIKRA